MKIGTLARLRGIYVDLTLAQRAQLMAIVQCDNQPLSTSVWESLEALELVCVDGDECRTGKIFTRRKVLYPGKYLKG